MRKLTSQMLVTIKAIYESQSLENLNNKTIKSLIDRGLIVDGQLSDEGKILALSKMKLSHQCQELSLDLIEIHLNYQGSPELAALQHFQQEGYIGSILEGDFILTVVKALILDKLEEYSSFYSRKDACVGFLHGQLVVNQNNIADIISSISKISRNKFISNMTEIANEPLVQQFYPGISLDIAIAFFDAVDLSIFEKIAIKLAENPYEYSKGWPDLTIIKDKEIRLIEIKTTDKLHASQLKTIPILREILPFEISVCKIKNLNKVT